MSATCTVSVNLSLVLELIEKLVQSLHSIDSTQSSVQSGRYDGETTVPALLGKPSASHINSSLETR